MKTMLKEEFEPQVSAERGDHSANCAVLSCLS